MKKMSLATELVLTVVGVLLGAFAVIFTLAYVPGVVGAPTATSTPTPMSTASYPTIVAHSPTPSNSITATPYSSPVIQVATRTPTVLPTQTTLASTPTQTAYRPTPSPSLEPAPVLQNASRLSPNVFLLTWSWTRSLAQDEYFSVYFWPVYQLEEKHSRVWTKEFQYLLSVDEVPEGDYFWSVAVIRDLPPPGAQDGSWLRLAESMPQVLQLPNVRPTSLPPPPFP